MKSSCVKSGKITKPILKDDMSDLQSSTSERCMGAVSGAGLIAEFVGGVRVSKPA